MVKVNVSPRVLQWALQRLGPSAEIAEKIRRQFPKLPEWLEGRCRPTLRQLEAFSQATLTPLGYFFLSEVPEETLPIPLFRTVRQERLSRASVELLELIQIMKRRQAWMREYLIEQGYERLPFVGRLRETPSPEEIAQQMRQTLHLEESWAASYPNWTGALAALRRRAEQMGIVVASSGMVGSNVHRPLNPEEFRGFVLVDEYVPLVFLNAADFKSAQMFTLAHELAHLWVGQSAAFDLRELQPADDKTEKMCDLAAAEFLVPARLLRQQWREAQRTANPLQFLARHFKVSEIVAARRALDLELIQKPEFLRFYEQYRKRQASGPPSTKEKAGGNFYATQLASLGRPFAETVVRAVQGGQLLYHEAYRMTGMYGKTFDAFVNYVYGK
jgi:Zn-dependent peptidase ImmA (M78 family)